MTKYFIHDGEKETGPFTLIELTSQNINGQTPVWHKGLRGWTKAGALEELQPLLALKLSPPPFKDDKAEFPPFTRAWGKGSIGIPIGYLIGALILIAGILLWYFSANQVAVIPSSVAEKANQAPPDSLRSNNEEAEKQRINAQIAAKKAHYRNNWKQYIQVKNDGYKHGFLGGIYNLEVEVVNETGYVLDEVIVLVHYIKDKGATFKTEPVIIYNVPAHGKAIMPAPDSNRGTSIKMEINAISSKKMNFCYSSDIDARGSDDPYLCKTK
jgi:hypothetical protein